MDSATLLGYLLENGSEQVDCCSFYYGSKHGRHEMKAAERLVAFYQEKGYPVVGHTFDVTGIFNGFRSALLLSGGEIPEGHYEHASMSKTVVPGRNMIFAAIMAGYAESIESHYVCLGVHSGDHQIYPDCRPDFLRQLQGTVLCSSDSRVAVIAPFIDLDKTKILEIGYAIPTTPVPYQFTRTCYKDQELSCGRCGSCMERLEAFHNIGKKDPIEYEN